MTNLAKRTQETDPVVQNIRDYLWPSRIHEQQGSELTASFVCPECGGDTLMEIQRGILQTTGIDYVTHGRIKWGDSFQDAPPSRRVFCCAGCGYVLAHEDGEPIHDGDELVEWMMTHCSGERERLDDEREVAVDSHAYLDNFLQSEDSPIERTSETFDPTCSLYCTCPYDCGEGLFAEIMMDLTSFGEITCLRDDGTWETERCGDDFTDVYAYYVCLDCGWPLTDGYGWPIRNEDQLIQFFIENGEQ